MKKLSLLVLLLIAICKISLATVLIADNNSYAPANAPVGHYISLQDAVNSASAGDTIYVVGSPTNYGAIGLHDSLTLIGAGYMPQKDFNYPSTVLSFQFINGWGNCKILGFSISAIYTNWVSFPVSGNNLEIAYNHFMSTSQTVSAVIETGANCNIHDNILSVNYTSYFRIIGDNNLFHNNIFSTGTIFNPIFNQNFFFTYQGPWNNNKVFNNTFLSYTGGYVFYKIENFEITNNIFYGCATADTNFVNVPVNCDFSNNLTFNTPNNSILFGSNYSSTGINYIDTMPLFVNPTGNIGFDFPPYDFSLQTSSVGHNGGTDGTDIGAFGGASPFSNYTGMIEIPQVVKLDLYNSIVGQGDSLKFHTIGYANAGDSIVAAEYFFDADTIGSSNAIAITVGSTFDFNYSIDHDSLFLGQHVFGFRIMNSNGVWSLPEMRSFEVCSMSGTIANFDYYVYGHDVIFANNSTDQQSCHWDFADGDTSNSTQLNFVHHFDTAGVFNICLNSINTCNPSGNTLCKTINIKGINSITPNKGGNIGVVTMTITGALFNDSTTVQLRDSIGNTFNSIDSSTFISDEIKIQTAFDLKGKTLGKYDVIVTVPGDTIFTVIKGFEVDSGKYPDPYVQLIGPANIHMNEWHNYSLVVENIGNIDAVGVPVWFAVPQNYDVEILFDAIEPPSDTSISISWDTIPDYFTTDTLFNTVAPVKVYGYFLPLVPALGYYKLNFRLRTTIVQTVNITYWVSRQTMLNDSIQINQRVLSSNCFLDPDKIKCIESIATSFSLPNPIIACIINYISADLQIFSTLTCARYYGGSYLDRVQKNIHIFNKAGLKCLTNLIGNSARILKSNQMLARYFQVKQALPNGTMTGIDCIRAFWGNPESKFNLFNIFSFDPNNKFGNSGVLNSPFINSTSPINYFIHCENVDTATAPAQSVLILDTLDESNLDLATFQLTQVGFGDTIISIPSGRKSFTTDIDLRPSIPLIARIAAYLNDSTGVATWSFTSLDTLTMEPTIDPLIGFLLPNDSTGRGEGFVSYSIKTKDSIATGTIINNKAEIYFDNNVPVTTQTWTNIIDDLKPQSQVSPLAPTINSDSIVVSWSGFDNGPAGVYAYNVFFNVNGGDWLLWKYNTSLTTDTFVGVVDSTYGFYSISIDSALNVEDAPLTADATTTITVGLEEITQSQMIVKLFPNPANNSVNIYIRRFDNSKNDFNIIARDITGRTIKNEKINLTTDVKTVQLDISEFGNGIYFFEITDGTHRTFRKLIKN